MTRAYSRDNRLFDGARCVPGRVEFDRAAGEPRSLARVLLTVISRARVLKRPSYYRFVRGGSVTIEQLVLLVPRELEMHCACCCTASRSCRAGLGVRASSLTMIGKHKQKRHGEKETRHNEDIDPHSALSRASRQICRRDLSG